MDNIDRITYLIKLTPQEPWFFGGDRIFSHPDAVRKTPAKYFIRSQDAPSQTTLFGALRYLLHSTKDWKPDADVGLASYDLTSKSKQEFGLIKGISPLYLMGEQGSFYIPAPLDHKGGNGAYQPYKDYKSFETNHGRRCYPVGYDGKHPFDGGWLRLGRDTVTVHTDLFKDVEQVGVNMAASQDGFFKRECKRFSRDGFCFAFFADFEKDYAGFEPQLVFLGQGRRAFLATCSKQSPPDAGPAFPHNIAYAQSPIYVEKPEELYKHCEFVCEKPVSFRKFATNYQSNRRFQLESELLQLIAPGSVFCVHNDDLEQFKSMIHNPQARIVGFNRVLLNGKELSL